MKAGVFLHFGPSENGQGRFDFFSKKKTSIFGRRSPLRQRSKSSLWLAM